MEVTFLGTGAFDYNPRLKTELKDCFDHDARRSSAILIDKTLLVDCGDWILEELRLAGTDCTAISQVLISHSHCDHFRADHLRTLAHLAGHPLEVWCSVDVAQLLGKDDSLHLHLIGHGIPFSFDGFTVTPLYSNHQSDIPTERTYHYLIEKNGKKLFYGYDGAWLPTATGKFLFGAQLDCYIFDATCGDYDNDYRIFEHNTLPMIRTMLVVMRAQKVFGAGCRLFLSHLAPSLHKSHAETVGIVAADGLEVAYDGLTVVL